MLVLHFPRKEFDTEEFFGEVKPDERSKADYYKKVDMALPAIGDIITKVAGGALDLKVVEREYSLDHLRWKIKLEIQITTSDADPWDVIRYFESEWSIEPL